MFDRFSRVILVTLCAVKFNIMLSEQMIPNNPKNLSWLADFFSFKVLTSASQMESFFCLILVLNLSALSV